MLKCVCVSVCVCESWNEITVSLIEQMANTRHDTSVKNTTLVGFLYMLWDDGKEKCW